MFCRSRFKGGGGVQWQRTLSGNWSCYFQLWAPFCAFQGRSVSVFVLLSPPSFPSFSHSPFTRIQIVVLFFSFCLIRLEAADGAWEGAIQSHSQRSGSDVSVTFFVTIKHSSCHQTCKVLFITTLNPRQPFSPLDPQTPSSVPSSLSHTLWTSTSDSFLIDQHHF